MIGSKPLTDRERRKKGRKESETKRERERHTERSTIAGPGLG